MQNKRLWLVFGAALLAVALLSGCEEWENYTPSAADLTRIVEEIPAGPTRDMIQATAVARYVEAEMLRQQAAQAQGTADAARLEHERRVAQMTAEAQAVERARASAAEATRQALDAQARQNDINATATAQAARAYAEATAQAAAGQATATAQAAHVQATATAQVVQATATAQAWAVQATATEEARRATATAQSERATATFESRRATATVQAHRDAVTATMVEATSQAVARLDRREAFLEPVRAVGVILLILLGVAALGWIGFRLWGLVEDRARLVRRGPDEGEPIMILDRERLALPLRQFGPYADMTQGAERAPMLAPSATYQERSTARQQTANLEHAHQTRDIVRARNQPREKVKTVIFPMGEPLPPPKRRQSNEGGLMGVQQLADLRTAAAAGIIAPALADSIEGQWEDVA